MRFHKQRVAWSVVWGVACLLLIVLWVRSYWYWDDVRCQHSMLPYGVRIMSMRGGAYLTLKEYDASSGSHMGERLTMGVFIIDRHGERVSNCWFYLFDYDKAYVPYWIVTVLSSVLAAAPWIRWSK